MSTSAYVIEVEDDGTIYVLYDDDVLIKTSSMSEALKTIEDHYGESSDPQPFGNLFKI